MKEKIRILHIEDLPTDAELIQDILRGGPFNCNFNTVDSKNDFIDKLDTFDPDLVLSDFTLPDINGKDVIEIVKKTHTELPVIIVTGTLDEETAVDLMKAGAADYILKENLTRLISAVTNALEKKRITEEKLRAEKQMLIANERMKYLLFSTSAIIYSSEINNEYNFTFLSENVYQMMRFSSEDILATPGFWIDHIHSGDRKRILEESNIVFEQNMVTHEYRFLRKDKSYIWLHDEKKLIRDKKNEPLEIIGHVINITDRKIAENDLLESEELYRSVVTSMAEGIVVRDAKGKIRTCNKQAEKILGLSKEQMTGKKILHPEGNTIHYDGTPFPFSEHPANITLKTGKPCSNIIMGIVKADESITWVSLNSQPIFKDSQQAVSAVTSLIDITDKKNLEEQLLQSQKLEGIGQLAGGIAHDFNNILTVINGYGELLLKGIGQNSSLESIVNEIITAGRRASSLTSQLLAFSRRQIIQPRILNINSLIEKIEKMLMRIIGENIQTKMVLKEDIHNTRIDPGQFDQIIMNLVVNARDAMPKGGKITIETQNVFLDENYSKQHLSVTPGAYVQLSISDSGMGMDEKTKARIFEPFFTTKEAGKGTGLGLATVYGIVKQTSGNIWVYSEIDKGTTFKIYFPAVAGKESDVEIGDISVDILTGSEIILVVEDDPTVRDLTCTFLKSYGYDVKEALDTDDAISIVKTTAKKIDLLITDVIMPKMSGKELADVLKKIQPEMKILFVTGYADNSIIHHGILDEGVNLLTKPFSPKELSIKVRRILGKK